MYCDLVALLVSVCKYIKNNWISFTFVGKIVRKRFLFCVFFIVKSFEGMDMSLIKVMRPKRTNIVLLINFDDFVLLGRVTFFISQPVPAVPSPGLPR